MMNKIKFIIAALAATTLLTACGEKSGSAILGLAGKVAPIAKGFGSAEVSESAASTKAFFAPEAIAAAPGEYVTVTVNALGLNELARRIAGDRAQATYVTQSGQQFTLSNGILRSTQGFGEDLMATGAANLGAAIRAGSGQITRNVDVLGVQDQIETRPHRCTFTEGGREQVKLGLSEINARRVNENCVSTKAIFENIYWLDNSGNIVASRQYVSPSVAYLRVNRL